MRHSESTSGSAVGWGIAGLAAGVVAGVALSEWVGAVDGARLNRVARRLQTPRPTRLTVAAGARAAAAALGAEPSLHQYALDALAVSPGVVELRGWVPSRAARALAARLVRGLSGIENVINSILVRGEDDLRSTHDSRPTDQSA